MTPRQTLEHRAAMMHDNLLYTELVGYDALSVYYAKSRLTEYFMSRVTSVPVGQRGQLTEATLHMLDDLPLNELFALDKQHFPEYYI